MRQHLEGPELTGWAVRMAREYRGLSIQKLADELELHRNTISSIENGDRRAKRHELKAIASVLNWPEEWLTSPLVPDLADGAGDMGGYPLSAAA